MLDPLILGVTLTLPSDFHDLHVEAWIYDAETLTRSPLPPSIKNASLITYKTYNI